MNNNLFYGCFITQYPKFNLHSTLSLHTNCLQLTKKVTFSAAGPPSSTFKYYHRGPSHYPQSIHSEQLSE